MVFGKEVDQKFIAEKQPDVLIIATGSIPIIPKIKGIDGANIKQANKVLLGEPVIGKVLVIDGGLVGVETAEYCTDYCDQVTIVEMMPAVAPDMYFTVREAMMDRFKNEGIIISTNTKVLEFTETGIICEFSGE